MKNGESVNKNEILIYRWLDYWLLLQSVLACWVLLLALPLILIYTHHTTHNTQHNSTLHPLPHSLTYCLSLSSFHCPWRPSSNLAGRFSLHSLHLFLPLPTASTASFLFLIFLAFFFSRQICHAILAMIVVYLLIYWCSWRECAHYWVCFGMRNCALLIGAIVIAVLIFHYA